MSDVKLKIRPPRFADNQWYSAEATELQTVVQDYLAAISGEAGPTGLMGLIAPHAGYFFSGRVAGAAFACVVPGAFETVILIGPDHRGAAPFDISTLQVDLWRTPLGDIPVDGELLQAIHAEIPLKFLTHDAEHSLEVELPFLQTRLQRFKLAPLMMGDQSPSACRRLGEALAKAVASRPEGTVLLVASSDLSHYFDDDTARKLDEATLQFILNLDADGLARHVETGRRQGQPYACGAGPIAAIIHAAVSLGANRATLCQYATSADAHPHKDRVVGYAAVAIHKT